MANRDHCLTRKVDTPFGSMYIHIRLDGNAQPVGGWISHAGKDPESQIRKLIESLSEGLNNALDLSDV